MQIQIISFLFKFPSGFSVWPNVVDQSLSFHFCKHISHLIFLLRRIQDIRELAQNQPVNVLPRRETKLLYEIQNHFLVVLVIKSPISDVLRAAINGGGYSGGYKQTRITPLNQIS